MGREYKTFQVCVNPHVYANYANELKGLRFPALTLHVTICICNNITDQFKQNTGLEASDF